MQKITKYAKWLLMALCLSGICGCGGVGVLGKKTMEIPGRGVALNIPAGWQPDNPQMCHKGDNTGVLMEESLEGKTFRKRAGEMSREFGSTVISESALKIGGHDAIKALIKTSSGDMLLRVYIHKGEKIIVISFAMLKNEYPANEPALRQSIQSIKINREQPGQTMIKDP